MVNPDIAVRSIQSDESFLHEIKTSTVEMVLRRMRWRVVNMSKEEFEDWLLNVEPVEFIQSSRIT